MTTTGYTSYSSIIDSFGYEVEYEERFGEYQGDFTYIFKDEDGKIGWLVIGYGSCSGCDALEDAMPTRNHEYGTPCFEGCGCNDFSRTVALRDDLYDQIRWEAPEDKEHKNDWFYGDENITHWLVKHYALASNIGEEENGLD